jgi:formylglycine-generating enzyme required for sulfatase activity
MIGLSPVYCSDAEFTTPIKDSTEGLSESGITTTPGSCDNPYVNWEANGYRLPTEGEYQYSASYIDGGDWKPYNYASGATADYTDAVATGLVAWYGSSGGTHNVGSKNPNAIKAYDMSGNVFEWCWDWYGDWPEISSIDYRGPTYGSYRISRGGNCGSSAIYLQVGFRGMVFAPGAGGSGIGFRIAKTK